MTTARPSANYVALGTDKDPVHVWYDAADDSIHITCNNPELTDENGQKPGFRLVVNANPKSADYNPANFNRLARHLRKHGKAAPDEAPIKPRQLSTRPRVIAELTQASEQQIGRPADPTVMGWATCPSCAAVVVDMERHKANSTAC